MTTRIPLLALAGSAACSVLLAGCGSTTPNYDTHFGEAVRTARLQMTINPDAGKAVGKGVDAPTGMDGRATEHTMDRYEQSYKTPPRAVNVINIGGSLTSNQNSGAGSGNGGVPY